jgi:SepF-like predicted cell division protein (DUF552 family)
MKNLFSSVKKVFVKESNNDFDEEEEQEYVELDTSLEGNSKNKILVRTFNLTDFADVKPIIDALREGNTIIILNIRPLKDKDMIEMKRAVNKIKKTVDAVEGDIAGFNDDYIIVTPNIAEIYRSGRSAQSKQPQDEADDDEDLDLM